MCHYKNININTQKYQMSTEEVGKIRDLEMKPVDPQIL